MLLWVIVADLRTLTQFQESEVSPGLFQEFTVFVPRVTQGNEQTWSVQDIILLLFWCESKLLRSRGSSRLPCVIPVVETFL